MGHLRLARTVVENLSWQECIARYDSSETVFYLDPPYWKVEGYGNKFTFENYTQMAELARGCDGKFVISINDHPDMRQVFKGFNRQSVGIRCTLSNKKDKERKELIFTSR